MAQFSVHRNDNPHTSREYPYLLNVQNDILASLHTCVVVPLGVNLKPIRHLNPTFQVEGMSVVMSTAQMAGVDRAVLGKEITSLEAYRREIIDALDFMVLGF